MLSLFVHRLLLIASMFGIGLALDAVLVLAADLIRSRRADRPSKTGSWQPLAERRA
jgi:hypothetical protein